MGSRVDENNWQTGNPSLMELKGLNSNNFVCLLINLSLNSKTLLASSTQTKLMISSDTVSWLILTEFKLIEAIFNL